MMLTAQRLSKNVPGRLACHPAHVVHARPHGSVQELDPEDPQRPTSEIVPEDETWSVVPVEEEAFRLHVQFMHAHGVPKGEFTTFSNLGTSSGDAVHVEPADSTR